MNYIYFELETSGTSPLYSQINGIFSAALVGGSFSTFSRKVTSLSDERLALTDFLTFAEKASSIAYPDNRSTAYISSCFEQYCLTDPFGSMTHCMPDPGDIISAFGVERFQALVSRVSVYGELKHFYKDYKNYYYLPAEDTASHKSVARFVDRSARVQATAQTAYTKKAGSFIPASPYSNKPLFRTAYNDPRLYISSADPDGATCLHLISHIPQGA